MEHAILARKTAWLRTQIRPSVSSAGQASFQIWIAVGVMSVGIRVTTRTALSTSLGRLICARRATPALSQTTTALAASCVQKLAHHFSLWRVLNVNSVRLGSFLSANSQIWTALDVKLAMQGSSVTEVVACVPVDFTMVRAARSVASSLLLWTTPPVRRP